MSHAEAWLIVGKDLAILIGYVLPAALLLYAGAALEGYSNDEDPGPVGGLAFILGILGYLFICLSAFSVF